MGASQVELGVKNTPAKAGDTRDVGSMGCAKISPWVGEIPWRKEWLPTPVFWPGEFHGLYSPWGCKESDMTE